MADYSKYLQDVPSLREEREKQAPPQAAQAAPPVRDYSKYLQGAPPQRRETLPNAQQRDEALLERAEQAQREIQGPAEETADDLRGIRYSQSGLAGSPFDKYLSFLADDPDDKDPVLQVTSTTRASAPEEGKESYRRADIDLRAEGEWFKDYTGTVYGVDIAASRNKIVNKMYANYESRWQSMNPGQAPTREIKEQIRADLEDQVDADLRTALSQAQGFDVAYIDEDPDSTEREINEMAENWGLPGKLAAPVAAWLKPYSFVTYEPNAEGGVTERTVQHGSWDWLHWLGQGGMFSYYSTAVQAGSEDAPERQEDLTDLAELGRDIVEMPGEFWRGVGTPEQVRAIREGKELVDAGEQLGRVNPLFHMADALGVIHKDNQEVWAELTGLPLVFALSLVEPDAITLATFGTGKVFKGGKVLATGAEAGLAALKTGEGLFGAAKQVPEGVRLGMDGAELGASMDKAKAGELMAKAAQLEDWSGTPEEAGGIVAQQARELGKLDVGVRDVVQDLYHGNLLDSGGFGKITTQAITRSNKAQSELAKLTGVAAAASSKVPEPKDPLKFASIKDADKKREVAMAELDAAKTLHAAKAARLGELEEHAKLIGAMGQRLKKPMSLEDAEKQADKVKQAWSALGDLNRRLEDPNLSDKQRRVLEKQFDGARAAYKEAAFALSKQAGSKAAEAFGSLMASAKSDVQKAEEHLHRVAGAAGKLAAKDGKLFSAAAHKKNVEGVVRLAKNGVKGELAIPMWRNSLLMAGEAFLRRSDILTKGGYAKIKSASQVIREPAMQKILKTTTKEGSIVGEAPVLLKPLVDAYGFDVIEDFANSSQKATDALVQLLGETGKVTIDAEQYALGIRELAKYAKTTQFEKEGTYLAEAADLTRKYIGGTTTFQRLWREGMQSLRNLALPGTEAGGPAKADILQLQKGAEDGHRSGVNEAFQAAYMVDDIGTLDKAPEAVRAGEEFKKAFVARGGREEDFAKAEAALQGAVRQLSVLRKESLEDTYKQISVRMAEDVADLPGASERGPMGAVVEVYRTGDVGTLLYEMGHIIGLMLPANSKAYQKVLEEFGENGKLTEKSTQAFAEAWKLYNESGLAPTDQGVRRAFGYLKMAWDNMWSRHGKESTLPPEIRKMFDGWVATNPRAIKANARQGVLMKMMDGTDPIATRWGGRSIINTSGDVPLWKESVQFMRDLATVNPSQLKGTSMLKGLARMWYVPGTDFKKLVTSAEGVQITREQALMNRAYNLVTHGTANGKGPKQDISFATFQEVMLRETVRLAKLDEGAEYWRSVEGTRALLFASQFVIAGAMMNRTRNGLVRYTAGLDRKMVEAALNLNEYGGGKAVTENTAAAFALFARLGIPPKLRKQATKTGKDVENGLMLLASESEAAGMMIPRRWMASMDAKLEGLVKQADSYSAVKNDGLRSRVGSALNAYARLYRTGLTSGILLPRPRYYVNIFFGNFAQMWMEAGLKTAAIVSLQSTIGTGKALTEWASQSLAHIPGVGTKVDASLKAAQQKQGQSALASPTNALLNPFVNGFYDTAQLPNSAKVTTKFGETLSLGYLRKAAQEQGVFASFSSSAVQEVLNRSGKMAASGALDKSSGAWADLADMVEQRQRVALFTHLVINEGKSVEGAGRIVRNALYDWGHVMASPEMSLMARFAMFWRFWKLAYRQAARGILEPFIGSYKGMGAEEMAKNPAKAIKEYYVVTAPLRRVREQVVGVEVASAMTQAALDPGDDEMDLHMNAIYPWWSAKGAKPFIANVPLSPETREWTRKSSTKGYATHQAYTMPALTPLDTTAQMMSVMHLLSTWALTDSAAGPKADRQRVARRSAEIIHGHLSPLAREAFEGATGKFLGETRFPSSPKIKPTEAAVLDAMGFPTVRKDEDPGVRRASAGVIFAYRMIPILGSELSGWVDPLLTDPIEREGFLGGSLEVMRAWTGFGAEYWHDPEKAQQHWKKYGVSARQRELTMESKMRYAPPSPEETTPSGEPIPSRSVLPR